MTQPVHARVAFLDVLRALAIALVMAHHFRHLPHSPEWFKWFGLRGYLGVDVFFVLSGWLIGGQLFAELRESGRLRIWRFWARRWLRTLPLYYGVFVFELFRTPRVRDHAFEMLVFVQNYTAPHHWLITWSLCIEEHFYLVLPLLILPLAWLARRSAKLTFVVAVVVILLSVGLRWLAFEGLSSMTYNQFLARFYVPTHLRMDGLFLGVGLAALRRFKHPLWAALVRAPWVTFGAGVLLATNAAFNPWLTGWGSKGEERMAFFNAVPQFFLVSLGVALLIAAGIGLRERGRDLRLPGAQWMAEHAYALYLIHWAAAGWISRRLPWPGALLAAIAMSLVAAVFLRQLLEVPGLKLRDRLFARRPGSAPAPGATQP